MSQKNSRDIYTLPDIVFCNNGNNEFNNGGAMNYKIFKAGIKHLQEMHPNANLVKGEIFDSVFKAEIIEQKIEDNGSVEDLHISVKAHIVDGLLIIEESKVDV